jgi:hypothetical protein
LTPIKVANNIEIPRAKMAHEKGLRRLMVEERSVEERGSG